MALAFTMFRRKSNSQSDMESDELQHDHKVNELKDALGPLSGRNLQYYNDMCLTRYLEAWNWNVDKSKQMLEETLRWRSTYIPEEIRWVRELISSFFDSLQTQNVHNYVNRNS